MADKNLNDAYKKAISQLDSMVKKQESLKKSVESIRDTWDAASTELFKMSGAEFFKQVPRSAEDLKELAGEVKKINDQFEETGKVFAKSLKQDANLEDIAKKIKSKLGGAFTDSSKLSEEVLSTYANQLKQVTGGQLKDEQHLKDIISGKIKPGEEFLKILKEQDVFRKAEIEYANDYTKKQNLIKDNLKVLKSTHSKLNAIEEQDLVNLAEILTKTEDLEDGTIDWENVTKNLNGEQRKLLALFHEDSDALLAINDSMNAAAASAAGLKDKMLKPKDVFDLQKSFSALGDRMKKDLIGSIVAFDETIHKVQQETGIMMDENSTSFAVLTSEVAQFGMGVEQAGQMMGEMSSKLNTTNFGVLSQATKDFAAIEGATGASVDSITDMASQMMLMGQSSAQVKDAMEGADQDARKFGVSSKKVIEGISKNMVRFRTMGFSGGEASLKKMVITAEKLHMSVDSIFNMADKARNIEGALDMAAELQLAGGSFSNINPMDLLSAARKGPQELQKILGKMGKDIGRFNADGEYEFDPIDADRLKIAADAAGVTVDDFQKMISTNAINDKKMNLMPPMTFQGIVDENGKKVDPDAINSMLTDAIDTNGKVVEGSILDKAGIKDLSSMTQDQVLAMYKTQEGDKKTLEEQNKRNQSMKKSFDNFINSLMSIFSVFQPVLEGLGFIFQKLADGFNYFGTVGKLIISSLLLGFTMFGTSVGAFITKGIGAFLKAPMNMVKNIKGMFSGAGPGDTDSTDVGSKVKGPAPKVGDGLKSLAEGLKAMGADNSIFKGIAAVALAGPAFLFFVPALPGLLVLGLIGTMDKQVTKGFNAIAQGLIAFGSDSAIFKGIGALMLAVIPLAIFGPASLLLLPLALIGALGPMIELGFKAISSGLGIMGNNLANIAKGVLAMVLVAAGVGAFALVASMMTDIDWMNVLKGIGVMALVTLGLIGLGFLLSGPGIVFLAIGAAALIGVGLALAIAGAGLLVAAEAFKQLGSVDWGAFSEMGGALLSVVPGLLGFSLAAMLFMNPLTLLGLMFMTMALGGLAAIMAPLATSLDLGASSLDRFASGLEKLGAAADKLSLEKLEKLKELSDVMASASAGGAAMSAMANVAGGGSGGGGEKTVRVEVDLKLNGKQIQTILASGKVDSTHNV